MEQATSLQRENTDLENLWLSERERALLCMFRIHNAYNRWVPRRYAKNVISPDKIGICPEKRQGYFQVMSEDIVRTGMGLPRGSEDFMRRGWRFVAPIDTAPFELLLQLIG